MTLLKLLTIRASEVLTVFFLFTGCVHTHQTATIHARKPKPLQSLDDFKFSVYPHIVSRDGEYFLQYQIDVSNKEDLALRFPVWHSTASGKVYYYFTVALSLPEPGNLREYPLEADGLTEFAKRDAVYWLNKDYSENKLRID